MTQVHPGPPTVVEQIGVGGTLSAGDDERAARRPDRSVGNGSRDDGGRLRPGVVADRPLRLPSVQGQRDVLRRPGDAHQGTARDLVDGALGDHPGIGCRAGDQAGRGEVEHRMQPVADPHVHRATLPGHHDRGVAQRTGGLEIGQRGAHRDGHDGQHRPNRQ